jgi:hypothetical protein
MRIAPVFGEVGQLFLKRVVLAMPAPVEGSETHRSKVPFQLEPARHGLAVDDPLLRERST